MLKIWFVAPNNKNQDDVKIAKIWLNAASLCNLFNAVQLSLVLEAKNWTRVFGNMDVLPQKDVLNLRNMWYNYLIIQQIIFVAVYLSIF
jgi:hypothetical protein